MKRHIIYRLTYALAIFLGIATIIQFAVLEVQYNHSNQKELRHIEFQGTFFTNENEEPQPITVEALEAAGATEYMTMTGHISEDIDANEQIFMYLRKISTEVYQNGKLIYAYGGDETHPPNVRSAGNIWVDFYADGINTEDEITLKFHNPYSGNSDKAYVLCLERLYVGDKMDLFWDRVKDNALTVIFGLLMLVLGIELLLTAATLSRMQLTNVSNVFHCGLLFAFAGAWLLIDYNYITLLIPYGITLDALDMMVTMGIPIVALRYVRNYTKSKIDKIFAIEEYILLAITVIYLLLQPFGIVDTEIMKSIFYMMFPVIFCVIFVGLGFELKDNHEGDARLVFASSLILIFFALMSYICFKITAVYGGSIFGLGLIGYGVVQYMIVVRHIRAGFQESIRLREVENELIESRIVIMLSQIQPHFLYNSISCIQELCLMAPQKAYDALAKFAHFLRGNMDSLTSTEPILFERELRHVENYLALEKIRFEDRLSVEYDIVEEGFYIPALTIQPIVENAVRYGISKRKSGGTVKISTYREKNEIVVEVADDGMGFDSSSVTSGTDGRSHVGMENVRRRLKTQCGGRLEVNSSSEGTTVKIIIPQIMD